MCNKPIMTSSEFIRNIYFYEGFEARAVPGRMTETHENSKKIREVSHGKALWKDGRSRIPLFYLHLRIPCRYRWRKCV